jgi:tetratricopeptide (TPR) repeat protein
VNPSPELVWINLAIECEEIGNWAAAEDARKKVLGITVGSANPATSIKPLLDLARLYQMLGRSEEAHSQIETALRLAHESGISSLVLMALESKYQLGPGDRELNDIREAAIASFDAIPNERVFDLTKARFLLLQAQCAVASGELETAEAQMIRADELVSERKQTGLMAGYQWFHSRAAELSASIHAARGEHSEAISAFSKSVERERAIDSQPHVRNFPTRYRLATTLSSYANHLEAGGKLDDAASVRAEADAMLREMKLPKPV